MAAAGAAAAMVVVYGHRGVGSVALLVVTTILVVASWIYPIVMYSKGSSQAHHMDEGFFVVMALILPPGGVLLAFFAATIAAQIVRRRPVVKAVFNVAQLSISVSAGIMTARLVSPPTHHLGLAELGAAALGAGVYFSVNSLALAGVLATTGAERFGRALFDGIEIRALLLAASVSLGLVAAMSLNADPAVLVIVVLPFIAFRQALSGHYQARHDRSRLLGLFDTTLRVNRSIRGDEVMAGLSDSAAELLRGSTAAVVSDKPAPEGGGIAAPMTVNGEQRWLTVSGRSRTEPFDGADRALLEALASVGTVALENSSLYAERVRERERLVAITSNLGEGVCAFDADSHITFANHVAESLLGVPEGELAEIANSDPDLFLLGAVARRCVNGNETILNQRAIFRRQGGGEFPVELTCSPIRTDGSAAGAVLVFRDISERVAAEEQLEFHAFHDALTGLPNRRILLDRLQHALDRTTRSGEIHAVLFADVDRFKLTNDSLGHKAGDELLVLIADELRSVVRSGDTLARIGGDEFTLLLEDIGSLEAAERMAQRVLEAARTPLTLSDGRVILSSLSIGIAMATSGASPDDVLHDADVAMYQAKSRGTGLFQTFDPIAMGRRSAYWLDLEASLRRGLENDELFLLYQPVIAAQSGRIVGAEALVRWGHPDRGTLSPADFIGLAEETGLILPLGRKVLEVACRQGRVLADHGAPISIAVNLSTRQFQQQDLVEEIRSVIMQAGITPGQLCLEITESLAMADIDRAIRVLVDLKSLGVRLAIDDFGTGYSSLNYLKRLPVDMVKLDRSFVQELDISPVDTAVVASVVSLAGAVGMLAVAEGVETSDQLERLKSMGCPLVQGYHLAPPVTASALYELLERQLEMGMSTAKLSTSETDEERRQKFRVL
ncbi:MAG TPA: EAL domain-containing protein [Acidimicrobiales bacterium]|nr:EAL domain-containing protein [Acidimicrobiales bacterium]